MCYRTKQKRRAYQKLTVKAHVDISAPYDDCVEYYKAVLFALLRSDAKVFMDAQESFLEEILEKR